METLERGYHSSKCEELQKVHAPVLYQEKKEKKKKKKKKERNSSETGGGNKQMNRRLLAKTLVADGETLRIAKLKRSLHVNTYNSNYQ